MLLMGDKKELVLVTTEGKYPKLRVHVVCFGRKRHYRKDGSCKHTEALLTDMKPAYRQRALLHPFGKSVEELP
jgi:hypothetical protein